MFRGEIREPGKFVALETARLKTFLQDHIGSIVDVVIREPHSRRSKSQNAYIHAVPIRIIAEHLGYTLDECKYALMGHCWGWRFCDLAGREIPVKPHTSEMTKKDCDYFIDWVVPWAAQELGLAIPLPNEGEP